LGSLEYAVEHLGVNLIMVLGHTGCGAVKATLNGGEPGTHIEKLAEAIRPAIKMVPKNAKDRLTAIIESNVRLGVHQLKRAKPILKAGCGAGKLEIHGACYDLASGAVNLL
jgi:carbonic anhydrase